MRIGIIRCLAQAQNCPGTGCFRAVKEKEGQFANYDNVELVGFTTCGGCPLYDSKTLLEEVELLLNRGAEVIHMSACTMSRCSYKDKMEEVVQRAYPNLKIIKGTHSTKLGWENIKDQYSRVIPERQE